MSLAVQGLGDHHPGVAAAELHRWPPPQCRRRCNESTKSPDTITSPGALDCISERQHSWCRRWSRPFRAADGRSPHSTPTRRAPRPWMSMPTEADPWDELPHWRRATVPGRYLHSPLLRSQQQGHAVLGNVVHSGITPSRSATPASPSITATTTSAGRAAKSRPRTPTKAIAALRCAGSTPLAAGRKPRRGIQTRRRGPYPAGPGGAAVTSPGGTLSPQHSRPCEDLAGYAAPHAERERLENHGPRTRPSSVHCPPIERRSACRRRDQSIGAVGRDRRVPPPPAVPPRPTAGRHAHTPAPSW